jgi:hypothetical protein
MLEWFLCCFKLFASGHEWGCYGNNFGSFDYMEGGTGKKLCFEWEDLHFCYAISLDVSSFFSCEIVGALLRLETGFVPT